MLRSPYPANKQTESKRAQRNHQVIRKFFHHCIHRQHGKPLREVEPGNPDASRIRLRQRVSGAQNRHRNRQDYGRLQTAEMKLFADKRHTALQNTDGTGQGRKEQEDEEYQSEQPAARKTGEYFRQRHKGKSASHAQAFRSQRGKHDRDNRKGRQDGHHGIQRADADRTLHQMVVLRNVGTVRHHNPHAHRKGKECLSQCSHQCIAVQCFRPDRQHK